MHAALTLACWKEVAELLPCLNSKGSVLLLLGLIAKWRCLQCSLLQMGAMHVKGGKTHWVPYRTEKCSSKTANRCAGNHNTKGWHNLGIGKIPGTVRHCCGMGITPGALPVALLMLHQLGTVFVCLWSVSYGFGPEWEVKLQEKCWLLLCAEIIRQHRQRLRQLTCGTLGSWAACFGKQGSEPLKAVMLFNTQGDPRSLQLREKHPCGVVRGLVASAPSGQGRLSVQRAHRKAGDCWGCDLPPLGVKRCWVQGKLWVKGHLDLFPLQPFPIRTSCGALQRLQSSGLFVLQEVSELAGPTWVLKGGVVVLEAVSSLFFIITCTSPSCVGGWWDTGKGGPCWAGDVTHTSPIFQCKQWSCCLQQQP